jgi:hypothetical protein
MSSRIVPARRRSVKSPACPLLGRNSDEEKS